MIPDVFLYSPVSVILILLVTFSISHIKLKFLIPVLIFFLFLVSLFQIYVDSSVVITECHKYQSCL